MCKKNILTRILFLVALATLSAVVCSDPQIHNQTEWVVEPSSTGLGIPPNHSYSQRRSSSEEIVSVPGCPKAIDGYPFVLYGKEHYYADAKCYLVGNYYSDCSGVMHYRAGSVYGLCQDLPPSSTPFSADFIQPGSCQEGYFWSEYTLSCKKRFGKGSPFYVG